MATTHAPSPKRSSLQSIGRPVLAFLAGHGAPIVFSGLLWWVLWWGHTPTLSPSMTPCGTSRGSVSLP
jgi:hypothetical protein